MFDKAEAEFRELSDKRVIVENDKSKIQKVQPQLLLLKQSALCLECACVGGKIRQEDCSNYVSRMVGGSIRQAEWDCRALAHSGMQRSGFRVSTNYLMPPCRAQVTTELDEKKSEALGKMWRKVEAALIPYSLNPDPSLPCAGDRGAGREEAGGAGEDVAQGGRRLRVHLRHAAAGHVRQAGAAGGRLLPGGCAGPDSVSENVLKRPP